MTKFVSRIFAAIACLLLHSQFIAFQSAVADEEKLLTIGSQAPDIDIKNWISDRDGALEHITKFQPKKIYVIEFWATWCGPCVASMPRLSEMQDKYIDDVQIISVSREEMETVESFLKRKVRGDDEKTYGELTKNYCLTVDSDKSVYDSYFIAADQTGIPCAFIVGKTGLIEWIGHPAGMEETLEKLVKDEWNRDEFLVEYKKSQAARANQRKIQIQMPTVMKKIQKDDAIGGVKIIDEMLANDDFSEMKEKLEHFKSMVLIIDVGGEAGVKEMKKFVDANSENPIKLAQIASSIYAGQQKGGKVDKTILKGALNAAQSAAKALPKNTMVQQTHARLAHQAGDLSLAIEIMKKSIENAEKPSSRAKQYLKQLQEESSEKQEADASPDEKTESDKPEAMETSSASGSATKN